MKKASILLAIVWLTGCATTSQEPQRFAWVTGLKPEKAEYYRQLHAHPWPAVNKMIKECHIRTFSIYERELDGKTYLFAYLEYTGKDFAADMKKMAADPETQRWWKEPTLPGAAARRRCRRRNLADTKEVYHLR